MTDVGAVATRKRATKKLPPVDSDYKPHYQPISSKRSPYLTRPAEVRAAKEAGVETEVSGSTGLERGSDLGSATEEEEEYIGEEGMARKEESELSKLMRFMVEREGRCREEEREHRREEEERRREHERARELELEKHREEERERRREEEERHREYERDRGRELERRREEEELRRDKRELQRDKLKTLGSYKESTELASYLEKFERIMKECGIKEEGWSERLFPRLPERLCSRVASVRDEGAGYEEVKGVLLKSVGETALTYGHQLFELSGEVIKHKTAGEICEQVTRISRGVLQGCVTLEQCVVALATALTRRVMPQAGKVFMESKKVASMEDLRDSWETWMSGRQKGNFYKPWMSEFGAERKVYRSEQKDGFGSREVTCFTCGGKGHRSTECNKGKWSAGNNSSAGARVITCFSCGKPGHRSVDCVNKKVGGAVKREGSGGKVAKLVVEGDKDNVAWGLVNGIKCKVLVDSGASVGVVPRSLLKGNYRDCGELHVADVHGTRKVHRSTVVTFELGGLARSQLAMIDEREGDGVISIVPINLTDSEEIQAFTRAITEYRDERKTKLSKEAEVKVLTRSQAKIEAELDRCEDDAEVEDLWCTIEESVHEELGDGKNTSVVLEEEGSKEEHLRESVTEGDEEVEGEPKGLESMTVSDSERELSKLAGEIGPMKEGRDGKEFRERLLTDDSLKTWRELGNRGERGFKWDKDLLLRGMYVSWEEYVDVMVVPKEFRGRVLEMAHERCGHLGGEKVARMVGRYFLWPGMVKEIEEYCRSCKVCQVKNKSRPRKVPAVDRPVLTEPFESVAVDLVGPLPKGKGGCRFLLTYICMATRWPEAEPLRSVTAKSVAEGLWSVFSRTAIPEVLLTDQGTQFCGRVVKQLCQLLGIDKLRTSPYHPQTNGMVERMHGTLKSVLGRCVEDKVDWVGQVPLALYVLRQMPHSDSGFSPFDLVFGFRVRTPLDALYHGIYEVEGKEMNVCDRVAGLMDRLERMRDCSALKMSKGKEERLRYYNKGSRMRTFEVGDLVLYRIPGMSCKLADSWEGPYTVLEKKGVVNYKIGKVGKESHAKVVHVNCMKRYRERAEVLRLDLVLEDSDQERNVLKEECVGFVQEELDGLLEEFGV